MGAVVLWAGILTRRHWRATALLGLLCGVAAGAVGTGWATARTTSRAFPQFVEASGTNGFVVACGTGTPIDFDSCAKFPGPAFRETVAGIRGVRSAARSAAVVGQLRVPGRRPALGLVVLYAERPNSLGSGSGLLLAGDRVTPERPGDIVVNESAARSAGIEVGQRLTFTPYLSDQSDAANGRAVPHGPPVEGRVVGIVRQPIDLAANASESKSANFDVLGMVVPPAWWAAEPDVYRYGAGVAVDFAPGADIDQVKADVVQALRPQNVQFETESGEDVSTVFDAIDYEVWAARAFALVIALVGFLLLGQALSRQTGRESNDAGLLHALGLTRSQLAMASGLRWTVTGAIAAITAVATMFAASPVAPIGVARRTIEDAHANLDVVVGLTIALATLVAIALGGAWSAWRIRRRTNRVPSSPLAIHGVRPAAATGITATLGSLRHPLRTNSATALGAIVLVAAAAIASAGLVHSYDRLLDRPPQFGAKWDAVVGNSSSPEEAAQVAARLSDIDGVAGAAGIVDLEGARVGREDVPIIAFVAAGGLPKTIEPAITDGRAPFAPGEIALGALTMRHLGLELGDEIRLAIPDTEVGAVRVRVVGRALLNNTYGLEPGAGGAITGEWARDLLRFEGSEAFAQQIAVSIADNADRAAVLRALKREFPESFSEPIPSTGLRNLGRIRQLPWTLVGMLALFGGGVALQALLASARRRRHELAVLRSIGFTAGNARASLRWQVATLSLIAAALSIPLGVLGGRLLWQLIARANGLAMGALIPRGLVALIVVLAFAVPIALIALPAWLEVRRSAGTILRTE